MAGIILPKRKKIRHDSQCTGLQENRIERFQALLYAPCNKLGC